MLKENLETKLIDFEGGKILGVRDEKGIVWLGVNNAMQDIGLTLDQCKKQGKKIKDDIVLNKGVRKMALPTNGGMQSVYVLQEDYVTLWLAKISLTPTMQKENPKAVEKLVNYQLKCAKVLHEAFFKTEKQKESLYNDLGLKGEIKDIKCQIENNTSELKETKDRLNTLIDNSTINSRQASKILIHAKDRVGTLLGGATSKLYKKESRKYFKNLWLDVAERFEVSTYKDLNPTNFNDCVSFISNWSFN